MTAVLGVTTSARVMSGAKSCTAASGLSTACTPMGPTHRRPLLAADLDLWHSCQRRSCPLAQESHMFAFKKLFQRDLASHLGQLLLHFTASWAPAG